MVLSAEALKGNAPMLRVFDRMGVDVHEDRADESWDLRRRF
jgi:hypothetical protein